MLIYVVLILGLLRSARAERPVEPVTYPKNIGFNRAFEPTDKVVDAKPLILTTVQFDHVDAELPDLSSKDHTVGLAETIEKLVLTAVHGIPRASVVMRGSLDQPIRFDGVTQGRRLSGSLTTKILSRSGIAPARDIADGARVSHVAIDRVGFELRWSNDFPVGKSTVRKDIAHVDSRRVGVVVGRDRVDLDMKLPPSLRAELIAAVKAALGANDPARIDPRIHVHLLDLNKNNFGAYALDAKLNEELVQAAFDRPPTPLLGRCAEYLERRF